MLTVYVISLCVGGVLVLLSTLSGLGHDGGHVDGGGWHETLVASNAEAPHLDADAHAVADAGKIDGHDATELALAGGPLAARARRRNPPRPSLKGVVASPRFWTFGACFFGLTGTALTLVTPVHPIAVGTFAAALGLGAGFAASLLVRRLRAPVGETSTRERWLGQSGELLFPLEPGHVAKVRMDGGAAPGRELLCALGEDAPMQKGARVVVVDVDAEGRVVVARESALLGAATPEVKR